MNKNFLYIAIPAILAILSYGALNNNANQLSVAHVPEEVVSAYSMWKLKHGKLYATPSEHNYRLLQFHDSWNTVKDHNNREEATYTLELNHFADMSHEEFTAKFAGASDPSLEQDEQNVSVAPSYGLGAPSSIDWSKNTGVTSYVKNQGSCGSCWAFASAAISEMEYNRVFKRTSATSFSAQKILDCSGAGSCNGGSAYTAEANMNVFGAATWRSYKYTGAQGACRDKTIGRKALGTKRVTKCNVQAWKDMLAVRPFTMYHTVSPAFKLYKSGYFNESACANYNSWHVVAVVGYNSRGFKIKNSWSSNWGDNGYFWFATPSGNCGTCNFMKYQGVFPYFRSQDA